MTPLALRRIAAVCAALMIVALPVASSSQSLADLDSAARALLTRAAEAGGVTARGWTRTLRLARTIADLEGGGPVRRAHVAEALIYRRIAPGTSMTVPAFAS